MNKINIRKARLERLNYTSNLNKESLLPNIRPYKEGKINYYDIEKMITASHIEVLIAEIDSKIVGSVMLNRNRKTLFKSRQLRIWLCTQT
jgi:hypothetical protein